jgi:hypothetical protein
MFWKQMPMSEHSKRTYKGIVTPALLIVTGAFMVVIYGLILVLTTQLDFSHRQIAGEQSLNIAEAGINYYRWHLAHDPIDFEDGTGAAGPYIHPYTDPQGNRIGQYSLEITPPTDGSSIVTIKSTGSTDRFSNLKRTITAQYGKPSFSRYAFLLNASTWFGTGSIVNGDVHSNNGIRMDGTNNGIVSSARTTYMCGNETGCQPPSQHPGVWGSGGSQALWRFPQPSIDFDAVSFDFTKMKASAQSDGLYLPSGNWRGYHLLFQSNGQVIVRRVNATGNIQGYRVPGEGLGSEGQGGCRNRAALINSESNVGTYQVADNPIIFSEEDLWLEGVVKGKLTVVSASFPTASGNNNIWIRNNLQYDSLDGTNRLGVIAQNDVLLARDLPNDFHMDGAYMAQKGQVIRFGFLNNCGSHANSIRQKLTLNGAIISYNKSYWNYSTPLESGFTIRELNYDTNLLYAPPPYFPTSGEYEFISWKEE